MRISDVFRRFARSTIATVAALATLTMPAGNAAACSIEGNFIIPQIDTLFGASYDGTNIRVVLLDPMGNPEVHTIAPPAGMPSSAYSNVRLSPSREFLFTWAVDGQNTDIYLYNVPPMGVGNFTPIIEGVAIPGQIAQRGWYDMPVVSPRRICYVASTRTLASTEMQRILWVDLDSGVHTFDPFDFNSPVAAVTFAPSGTCALVQHDTNDISVTDYNVISLCDGTFGSNIAPGALLNLDEAASGRVVRVRNMSGSPVFDVEVYHQPSQGPEVIDRVFTLDDCACTGVPVVGACCFADGSCMPAVTQADCIAMSGTAWTPGVDCAVANCNPADPTGACCFPDGSCMTLTQGDCTAAGGMSWFQGISCVPNLCPQPVPQLAISISGPNIVYAGQAYTYQLNYSNAAARVADASNVVVRCSVPNGAVFQGASDGGDISGGQVTWNLGDLAAGESGMVQLDVLAFCSSTQITTGLYSIDSDETFPLNGVDQVTSTVEPEFQGPMDILVTTTSLPNDPVHKSDRIRFRVSMTNPTAEYRPTIRTNIYPVGGSIDAVIDDGGGTAMMSGSSIDWRGDFDPGQTRHFEFELLADDCFDFFSEQVGIDYFDLRIGCGPTVASDPGLLFPIFREVSSTFEIIPTPGVTGPASGLPEIYAGQIFGAVRKGGVFEIQATLDNNTNEVQTGLSVSGDIPAGLLPVGDPPFVAPTDANAWYDSGAGTFGWSGDIPPNGQIVVRLLVQVDPATAECSADSFISGGEAGCDSLRSGVTMILVPEIPAEPYLVGLSSARGLWMIRQGETVPESFFCLGAEINTTMTSAPNGDIYVSGLAAYRFNPITLDFEVYDFNSGEGGGERGEGGGGGGLPGTFSTVAFSAADDVLYWLGQSNTGAATIWEMPAGTADPSVLYEDFSYSSFERGVVDPEGRVVVPGGDRIIRIDPAAARGGTSPVEELLVDLELDDGGLIPGDSGGTFIERIAIDADGNYLMLISRSWALGLGSPVTRFTTIWGLGRYDRTTDTAELIADRVVYYSIQFPGSTNPAPPPGLNPMYFSTSINLSMGPGRNGEIFLGGNGPNWLVNVGRACGIDLSVYQPAGSLPFEFGPVALMHSNPSRPFEGDVDMDGFINFTDLNLVLANWGSPVPMGTLGDLDMNGEVNQTDLELVLGTWNFMCPTP